MRNEYQIREICDDEDATTDRERLLQDFGVEETKPELCLEEHEQLRANLNRAMEAYDEVVLSEMVDRARSLGPLYKWQGELDEAEEVLYRIASFN
jgi:hypothetical protein